MIENRNEKGLVRWLACPMLGERVRADVACAPCPYWTGETCRYHHRKREGVSSRPPLPPRQPRRPRSGRGLRVPPVWEKWPDPRSPVDAPVGPADEDTHSEYGLPGLLTGGEEPLPGRPEEEAPEDDLDQAGHGFDVCPDVPEWLETAGPDLPAVSSEHELLEGPFPSSPVPGQTGQPLAGEPEPPGFGEPDNPFAKPFPWPAEPWPPQEPPDPFRSGGPTP